MGYITKLNHGCRCVASNWRSSRRTTQTGCAMLGRASHPTPCTADKACLLGVCCSEHWVVTNHKICGAAYPVLLQLLTLLPCCSKCCTFCSHTATDASTRTIAALLYVVYTCSATHRPLPRTSPALNVSFAVTLSMASLICFGLSCRNLFNASVLL